MRRPPRWFGLEVTSEARHHRALESFRPLGVGPRPVGQREPTMAVQPTLAAMVDPMLATRNGKAFSEIARRRSWLTSLTELQTLCRLVNHTAVLRMGGIRPGYGFQRPHWLLQHPKSGRLETTFALPLTAITPGSSSLYELTVPYSV